MTTADADRWNARYRDATVPDSIDTHELVAAQLEHLAAGNRVLDLACGFGDAGLAAARHGCAVTLVDVSDVALDVAARRARDASLDVSTEVLDLDADAVPAGPWDMIICVHYLNRDLLASLGGVLSDDGRVVVAIATRTNLERHERPSPRFLLEPGELPTLLPDLRVLHHEESWRANGAHEAWLVAGR